MASCETVKANGAGSRDTILTDKLPSQAVEGPGLPSGFPSAVDSPLAWTGDHFTDPAAYVRQLSEDDQSELRAALASFMELGLDGDEISPESFPLPNLGPALDQIRQELYSGKGFAVLRGLVPRDHSVEELTTLQLGILGYLSNKIGRQDDEGNMLVHIVADDSTKMKAAHHRHSTKAITFHNEEAGDVVSWLARGTAAKGGKSVIASSYAVYNVLAASHPHLIRALAGGDWPFALPRFHCRPILFNHDGHLVMNFGRSPLMGSASHPRPDHLPALSTRQVEALDAVEDIARATELQIDTRAGDLVVINNLAILHRRDEFTDGAGSHEKRHLVRSIHRDEKSGWSIPGELKDEWSKAFEGNADRKWHLEPMPSGYFPLRSRPN